MANYNAYDIDITSVTGTGQVFTITSADAQGFSISDPSSTDVSGFGNQLLGHSAPTDTLGSAGDRGFSGESGFNNIFYTSDTGSLDASQANDLRYIGTAIINGVPGFIAQVMTIGGDTTASVIDSPTSHFVFIVPETSTQPAVNNTGTFGNFASDTVTSGDWNLAFNGPAPLFCFLGDTMIATVDGQKAVKDLAAGDVVLTASGAVAPVCWVGASTVSRVFADPARVLPVRVKAGALGENLPVNDLMVSPGHALLLDGVLVQAGALVNGTSIVIETAMPVVFTYYHVQLDSHDVLLAEGVAAESFLDGAEDMRFDNIDSRPAQVDGIRELPMARVKSARQVPASIRATIAARAALVAGNVAAAA